MKIVINPIKPALCEADSDFEVLVRLQSEPQPDFVPTPLNLVMVIDRSGSMEGSKLREAKRCVVDLLGRLSPTDQVAVVQYDDTVETVVPLAPVRQARANFAALVQAITAGGSTDLHAGWLKGGELLAPHTAGHTTCHVMLLSDGQANRGLTEAGAICEQVAALAGAGVTTTTLGLGADFNEELMTAMAHAGQGRAHYGERAIDLAETFEAEISLLTHLRWRGVRLSVKQGPDRIEMLNAYQREGLSWCMPSVAVGSECWGLMRMSMREAVRLQREAGTALAVNVQAVDAAGQRFEFAAQLESLPIVSQAEYAALQSHELVQRRIDELRAAQIQLDIRQAVLRGDWALAEQILQRLETLGSSQPWIAASIAFTRELMAERDELRMSKEMIYKSNKMRQRLSSTNEVCYREADEVEIPAFLRRKTAEGRRTQT